MKAIHFPRLDTIKMVESAIFNSKDDLNKRQLWLSLPKKMMYQTFCIILEYLEESGKIMILPNGLIIWTHNPELLKNAVPVR